MTHGHAAGEAGLRGLATLPWFTVRHGRLVVDGDLGPVIDAHAHLALAFVRPHRVDLGDAPGPTRHYLPVHQPTDLDRYANQNLTGAQRREMVRDLGLRGLTRRGLRTTHTVPNLLQEMDDLGIARAVLLPIDLPRLSDNTSAYLDATEGEDRLACFGSVHPASRSVARRLDDQLARGIRGIKLHPANQLFRADWDGPMALYEEIGRRDLPVLWHCGPVGIGPRLGQWMCGIESYEPPLREYPDLPFLLGHSGALAWEEGLRLARTYDNAILDLSCVGLEAVRTLIDRADPDRIVFGSDWPFYHQALPLAKVLLATEGRPRLREKILWENAEHWLGLS